MNRNTAWGTEWRINSNKGIKDLQSSRLTQHCKSIKEWATLHYNSSAKTPRRQQRMRGDLVWDELHPLHRLTQYLALLYWAERSPCGFAECLCDAIKGIWRAGWFRLRCTVSVMVGCASSKDFCLCLGVLRRRNVCIVGRLQKLHCCALFYCSIVKQRGSMKKMSPVRLYWSGCDCINSPRYFFWWHHEVWGLQGNRDSLGFERKMFL